jgi:hypothetical protein
MLTAKRLVSSNLYSSRFTVSTSVYTAIGALLELDIDISSPALAAFPYVHGLAPGRWLVVLAFFLDCI